MFVIMYGNCPMSATTDIKKAYQEAERYLLYDDEALLELKKTFELDSADFGAGKVSVIQVTNLDELY